jgi:hypothetical protein
MADVEAEEFYSFEDFEKDNPEDEILEIVSDEIGEDVEDLEEAEKCFDEAVAVAVVDPPTDFEELDAEREARQQAMKVREIGWDADRLLSNIVHSSVLEPDEKEGKIKKVGSDFAKRLTNIVQDKKEVEEEWEPSETELDKAEAEMWAIDHRQRARRSAGYCEENGLRQSQQRQFERNFGREGHRRRLPLDWICVEQLQRP